MSAPAAAPVVAVIIPCHDEAGYIDPLLDQLLLQLDAVEGWSVVAVDDASSDATGSILASAAARDGRVAAVAGRYGSPGAARSAGIALALEVGSPDWIVTLDADVMLDDRWVERWHESIFAAGDQSPVGAINGVEVQDHLFVDHPNAAIVSAAFGLAVGVAEGVVGVTNLNGVNHAVRTSTYLTAGPYVQPMAPGPEGPESLAGEDWDLGVRIRRAGFTIHETDAAVIDRGRRLLTDVVAYVSGEAYEGPFRRLAASNGSPDVPVDDVDRLVEGAVDRCLRHFLCKPILAEAVAPAEVTSLSASTLDAMAAWMHRWPHPTFEESRNGFVFGRLERFSDAFVDAIRNDLDLGHESVLARLRQP